MRPSYEQVSHTADTGIVTRGATLEEVVGNAAFAMFDLMYELDDEASGTPVEFELAAASPPDLLVAVLGELLYRSEVDDLAFNDVLVRTGGDRVLVRAHGHPVDPRELRGPPIKAVTYHDLRCEPTEDGWLAQVIFDV